MYKKRQTILLIALMLTLSTSIRAQSLQKFKDGDSIVFLGNSITDGGHYHSYIWLYYMTRFPEMRIQIFNSGISADAVSNMYKRFDTDVLVYKPNYLVLTFGMNDSGYAEYNKPNSKQFGDKKYEEMVANFGKLNNKIKSIPDITVGIMTSTPYEEIADLPHSPIANVHVGKTDVMLRMSDYQKSIARDNNWGFVDLISPMLEINREGQRLDPSFTISGGDRVHPSHLGHMVMAYYFLKAQGFSNEKVSSTSIDVNELNNIETEFCEINNLEYTQGVLSFDYLAQSLPYPTDTLHLWGSPSQHDALKYVPFMDEMNQEVLTVKGLDEGIYSITIDSELISEFSSQALSNGINLANYVNTPQYQQAISVMLLNEERWEIERRIRQYKGLHYRYLEHKDLLFEDTKETLDILQSDLPNNEVVRYLYPNYSKSRFEEVRNTWEQMQQLLVDRIYTINKPLIRTIKIIKQ